jgi:hypothetical protein
LPQAGLPFRLTACAAGRLADLGWTFEVAHEAALRPPPPLTWNRSFVLAEGMAPPEALPSPMLWRPAPTALRDLRFPPRPGPPRVLFASSSAMAPGPMMAMPSCPSPAQLQPVPGVRPSHPATVPRMSVSAPVWAPWGNGAAFVYP